MRPRSNTYKEVNSRPHSSISMVYSETVWDPQPEQGRHTLEREKVSTPT